MIIQIDKAIQRKQELDYYREELKVLESRAKTIQHNINTAREIIKIIETEKPYGAPNDK